MEFLYTLKSGQEICTFYIHDHYGIYRKFSNEKPNLGYPI